MRSGSPVSHVVPFFVAVVFFLPFFAHAQNIGGCPPLCAPPPSGPSVSAVHIVSANASTSVAGVGTAVTLSFTSGGISLIPPRATIAGHVATVTGGPNLWIAVTTMLSGDAEGSITFLVQVGNNVGTATTTVSATTDGSSVRFDGTPPIITLSGDAAMTLTAGDTFNDPGASAVDAVDGTDVVITTGSVDTSTAGTYTLEYNASDAAGNAATSVTRTITVNAPAPAPIPAPSGGGGNGPIAGSLSAEIGPSPTLVPVAPTDVAAEPAPAPIPAPVPVTSPTSPVPALIAATVFADTPQAPAQKMPLRAPVPAPTAPDPSASAQTAAAASFSGTPYDYRLEILLLILLLSGVTWWVLDSYNVNE